MRKNVLSIEITKSGCWEWIPYRDRDDYGLINISGKLRRAHRFSYELFFGEIPKGQWVLHKGDNPPCINPAHLFCGTAKTNADDRDLKKRVWRHVT